MGWTACTSKARDQTSKSWRLFDELEHPDRLHLHDLSRGLKLDRVSRANPPVDPRLAVDVFHPGPVAASEKNADKITHNHIGPAFRVRVWLRKKKRLLAVTRRKEVQFATATRSSDMPCDISGDRRSRIPGGLVLFRRAKRRRVPPPEAIREKFRYSTSGEFARSPFSCPDR